MTSHAIDAETLQAMAHNPAIFRQHLTIEVSGEVCRYSDVETEWQRADHAAMDRAWLKSVGRIRGDVSPMRGLLERPRGCAKTFDLGMMLAWALAFAPKRRRYILCAGDRDQARHPIAAIEKLIELNSWLGATLQVQRGIVRNPRTNSEAEIISADAPSGYGHLVDGVLIDELFNWQDTDAAEKVWFMLSSTFAKKKNCLGLIISNAGFVNSWQWPIREKIREYSGWYFHSLSGVPTWLSEGALNEQRSLLSPSAFSRLYGNNWSSGTDSGLSPADVEACCVLSGPQLYRDSRYDWYCGGTDLGWKHDRTAVVILALSIARREIALACAASWNPRDYPGGQLPLSEVEEEIYYLHTRFQLDRMVFDPKETMGMSQALADRGVPCSMLNLSSPRIQDDMAKSLVRSFNERIIKIYRHSDLIADLLSLEVLDRTTGLKLEAPRSSSGHADLAFAFAMSNFRVHEAMEETPIPQPEILYA
jgi:hypothetical protein